MRIESIEPVSRDRVALALDSGERFILYKGELRMLKIKGVGELSDETYGKIVNGILPKRAKYRALNLLKARNYTEYQLRLKLREGSYPEACIEEAISYVKSFGYINDSTYAEAYIAETKSRFSRKAIFNKLVTKGIDKEIIEAAFLKAYGDYDSGEEEGFDEVAVIKQALIKKGYTGEESYEAKQKLLGYFYRKGFMMDNVYKAMSEFKD